MAPIITAAATWFTDLAKKGFDAGAMVRKGIDLMAAGLGAVLDLFQDLWPAMKLVAKFGNLLAQPLLIVAKAVALIADGIAWIIGADTKFAKSVDTLVGLRQKAIDATLAGGDMVAGIGGSEAINGFLDGLQSSVADGVETGITRPDAIATVAQEAAAVAEPVVEQAKPPISASTATAAAVQKGTSAALSAIFRARRGSEEGKLDRERNVLAEEHISISEDIRDVLVSQPPLLIAGVAGISAG